MDNDINARLSFSAPKKAIGVKGMADKNALRRKNMIKRYGRRERVCLYRKGNVFHLLTEMYIPGPADMKRFGKEVAFFSASADGSGWFTAKIKLDPETTALTYPRLSLKDLLVLIGPEGEVCMGGRNCPKH